MKKIFTFDFWQKIRQGFDGRYRGHAGSWFDDQYRQDDRYVLWRCPIVADNGWGYRRPGLGCHRQPAYPVRCRHPGDLGRKNVPAEPSQHCLPSS